MLRVVRGNVQLASDNAHYRVHNPPQKLLSQHASAAFAFGLHEALGSVLVSLRAAIPQTDVPASFGTRLLNIGTHRTSALRLSTRVTELVFDHWRRKGRLRWS